VPKTSRKIFSFFIFFIVIDSQLTISHFHSYFLKLIQNQNQNLKIKIKYKMVKFSFTSFVATTLAVAATATTALELPSCEGGQTIADVACNPDGDFTTLCAAVVAAGLAGVLSDPAGTFTVWAPTNDAFNNLPDGTVATLLTDEGIPTLTNILLVHVAGDLIGSDELFCGGVVDTLGLPSSTFTECLSLGNTIQTGSNEAEFLPEYILQEPVITCNGFIYPITNVIIPALPTDEPTLKPTKKMKKTKKRKNN
jgi:transforming growth factor-beta-induced protein